MSGLSYSLTAKSPLLNFCQCGIFWRFFKKVRPDSELKKPKRITLNCVISEWICREQSKTRTSDLVLGPDLNKLILSDVEHSTNFEDQRIISDVNNLCWELALDENELFEYIHMFFRHRNQPKPVLNSNAFNMKLLSVFEVC